jgi:hypothetical protein
VEISTKLSLLLTRSLELGADILRLGGLLQGAPGDCHPFLLCSASEEDDIMSLVGTAPSAPRRRESKVEKKISNEILKF